MDAIETTTKAYRIEEPVTVQVMKSYWMKVTIENFHNMEREVTAHRAAAEDYVKENDPGYEVRDFERYFSSVNTDDNTITYYLDFTAYPIAE